MNRAVTSNEKVLLSSAQINVINFGSFRTFFSHLTYLINDLPILIKAVVLSPYLLHSSLFIVLGFPLVEIGGAK